MTVLQESFENGSDKLKINHHSVVSKNPDAFFTSKLCEIVTLRQRRLEMNSKGLGYSGGDSSPKIEEVWFERSKTT